MDKQDCSFASKLQSFLVRIVITKLHHSVINEKISSVSPQFLGPTLPVVEMTGLEPAASCSQSTRATSCATSRYFVNLSNIVIKTCFVRPLASPLRRVLLLQIYIRFAPQQKPPRRHATPFCKQNRLFLLNFALQEHHTVMFLLVHPKHARVLL